VSDQGPIIRFRILLARRNPAVVVFSDLDGTLLDHDTYGFEAARPALDLLRGKNIPLILCSSKTRAEMEGYQKLMGIAGPFIVENGAAVYIPQGRLDLEGQNFREADGFQIFEWGRPYAYLVEALREIREETGLNLISFSEMSVADIGHYAGLDPAQAEQAKKRDYSEPFVLVDRGAPLQVLEQAVQRRRLTLVRGGRFYHLVGDNDKGRAVRWLTARYRKKNPNLVSIGLGDSPNDLPLLENVDIPVLVKKPGGRHEAWRTEKEVYYTRGIGPQGWNEALLTLLPKGDAQ
jgi:mannosyl-3-phosphoglycerate phosphatase